MMKRKYFHTQESRETKLTSPIKCIRDDAWLGEGYYFWCDLEDAENWGQNSKKSTGYYEIYSCEIFDDRILDTVFNETHYYFWLKQIEKVARKIIEKTEQKPTLKELNDYFKERGTWDEVDGIKFQDLPSSPQTLFVKPIQYGTRKRVFAYRKRIQIAVYNIEIIANFTFLGRREVGGSK